MGNADDTQADTLIATYFIHINRPKPSTALLQALCAQKLPNEQTLRQEFS